ncbi:YbfB/YjiJ family MFS transporter [Calidifontibacillus erzurumensis]|uniref:YbfB/YjiJ family MFS transporter n=1 Tax=Calidifontibacillus erzurumensis TaxID=2741433 RepID=A0A8J8GEK8_9BACI|nr:YbfB/YjiJ family MFS transporter [Calidifontibacillus erzurumensis]NSL50973.1 YbfB/YjiJ family MFS transporter [Calidifontibacillus erzurumensis]
MAKKPFLFLIGGIFALMVAMGIGRFAYTPLLVHMQNDLGFSDAVAGYLATTNYAGYLIGAIIASMIPMNGQKTSYLRKSLILSVFTTTLMGATHFYWLMFVLRFLSGVASAFVFIVSSSIVLDRLAKIKKTYWSGLFYSGVGLGIFFTSLIIPKFNQIFEWEGSWAGLGIISGILTLYISFSVIELKTYKENQQNQQFSLQIPSDKSLSWLIIAYGLEGLGYIVTGTFIVVIAEKNVLLTFDPIFIWMVVGLAAIPSSYMWSILGKKWRYVHALILAMLLQAIGICLPVISASPNLLLISAVIFGGTFMGITNLATTLCRQIDPNNSSRTIGIMTVVYAIGQMIGPSIAGIIADITNNYNSSLFGAAMVVFIGGCLLINCIPFEKKQTEFANEQLTTGKRKINL